jgi:hypothetical protein
MVAKMIRVSLLIGVFLFSVLPLQVSAGQDDWWNDTWSFRQELVLGSITSEGSAAYQPIDIPVRFDSPCWAVNETQHSVRVLCQNKNDNLELESQLYALVFSDQTHIMSCNLVFLIPPQTDGTERYYMYYDEAPTISPGYPDHVSIAESSYFYEPIPGYPLESSYYKITQHDSIRYVVAQEGQFLWYTTSQCVTKLVEGSTEVLPKNGEAIASFEYAYYYGDEMWQYSSTSQEIIAKEILCDGNLMVCCQLLSRSTAADLQTTAMYKYYYCPTSSERIQVHVVHEALKECKVFAGANTDGLYASMQCGGIRSASIADLNFGEIYPFSHFYSEQDTVEEYTVDLTPEYSQEDPVLWLIQTPDDVDMGQNAWVSFDEGTTGNVHALIFGSSSVIKAGTDERDGISLKAYESNYPHFPGLDYTVASVECTRNAYEKNVSGKDSVIPKGFIAEFDAEFFSSTAGGYLSAEEEAGFFRALVPMKPSANDDRFPEENASLDRFSLMVNVHNAPSFPFGSALSALTGRSFPYITVEVYRDNELMCSGTAGRFPLKGSVSSEGSSLRERVSGVLHLVDFRNISLWKRFHFQQLEAGRYVVKVFKENPRVGDERRFIGVAVVDLTKDSQIHVFCKPQGSCVVSLVDQQGIGITNAEVMLLQDGMVIAHNSTNENGVALLTAPCNRKESYQLTVWYQGFEVVNESIRLRYSRIFVPLKKSVELDQYDWTLTLLDLWGLPPEVEVTPRLTSAVMQTQSVIFPTQNTKSSFEFTDLLPATYHLQIQYKSFAVDKEIIIPSNDDSLVFPAEFQVSFHVFDSRGTTLEGMIVEMSRGGKTQESTSNGSRAVFSVPPGLYLVKVFSQGDVIGQRFLNVVGERSVDLITNQEPVFPLLVIAFACIFVIIGLAFVIKKKEPLYFLLLLMVSVLMIALVFPWWSLQGSSADVRTSSTLYLIPLNLVSTTTTPQVIGGDLTFLPEVFTTIMMIIPIIAVIVGLLAVAVLVVKKINKKGWQILLMAMALVLLLGSLVLFIVAMSAFAEVGVGSFMGNGTIDISIQGLEVVVSVLCQWGPGIGFWLYVIAGLLLLSTLITHLYQKKKKKNRLF